MHVVHDHENDQTIMDTAAMAALTGRRPGAVRVLCEPGEDGLYDVDVCSAALTAHPVDPVLLTATEIQRHLGIPRGTVYAWAGRGHIRCRDHDEHGMPLYCVGELPEWRPRPQAGAAYDAVVLGGAV